MANIVEYLDWRGDISFETDPFNEVDNLLLAEMSYIDFEGVLGVIGEPVLTIQEAAEKYFSIHTKEEILARETFTKTAPIILEKMAGTKRFGGLKIGNYVSLTDESLGLQMAAVTFFLGDGTAYVSFRGTDDTIVGWKEDFEFSYMNETPGQMLAAEYLNRAFAIRQIPLRVGGHSKGGNFAVYAAAFCAPEIREKLIRVYSNDGPGFKESIVESEAFQAITPLVEKIIPEASMIGMLLEQQMEHRVVKSSVSGMLQHDALTWQVLGNHFVRAESRDTTSHLFDDTVRNWVAGFSDEERQKFVESFFDLFYSTGASTFSEVKHKRLESSLSMMTSLAKLPKKDRQFIIETLGLLLDSGVKTVYRSTKESNEALKASLKASTDKMWSQVRRGKSNEQPESIDKDSEG